ncbi:nuclear GTPase SLIP-GC-like [Alligator mississippiensis]|uniref:Nuclear GTPase SLIP-GC-like n=1 Tax=Alligator mississippiensis TaxID=8496 RepID=A0A151P4U5_ALLMI|nr:nuclear GTPase SLIP-GC-like [Alligator mississippiensis]
MGNRQSPPAQKPIFLKRCSTSDSLQNPDILKSHLHHIPVLILPGVKEQEQPSVNQHSLLTLELGSYNGKQRTTTPSVIRTLANCPSRMMGKEGLAGTEPCIRPCSPSLQVQPCNCPLTDEDMESETKKTLDTAFEKLLNVLPSLDNMPDGAWYLKDRLSALKAKSSLDPIYIGLFGTTGAGKSTLLNAILEKKFFLPVSGSRTCTSCIVEIKTSQTKYYEANIHLLSDEEWKKELRNLVELLSKTGEEDEEGSHNDADVEEVIQKLQSIYGQGAETKCYEDLLKMKPVIKIPTLRRIPLKGMSADELSEKLDPYVRRRSDEDEREPAQDGDKEKMRFWPLIKHVEVTLPRSDVLPEGVVFIDIPGTGDFNSKRDQMWKEVICPLDCVWENH